MEMQESILVRKRGQSKGQEQVINGVFCSENVGIQADNAGFVGSGQLIVRMPEEFLADIECGDQICRVGSYAWYTVAQIQDNRRRGSNLSHWKIVGKR